MQVVRLIRTGGALEYEYGRVILDEGQVYFEGFSSIFASWIARGIGGAKGSKHYPSEGIEFLRSLRSQFSNGVLRATDAACE